MLQLKLWYLDMLRRFPDLLGLELVLWGGFWSNDDSWDVDIFLVPEAKFRLNSFEEIPKDHLKFAHDLITYGIDLAIEHYRFLVDITAATWYQIEAISLSFREFSLGRIERIEIAPEINCGLGIHSRVRKIRNGEVVLDNIRRHRKVVPIGEGKNFFVKVGGPFDKQMQHIRNGRIYYEAVTLNELFD